LWEQLPYRFFVSIGTTNTYQTMNTFTSISSEGNTATRNSKNMRFAFAVWMANTPENMARGWFLAGPRDMDLHCTNWYGSMKSADQIAKKYRSDGFRVEIRTAINITDSPSSEDIEG
jgi:hypothetical protein